MTIDGQKWEHYEWKEADLLVLCLGGLPFIICIFFCLSFVHFVADPLFTFDNGSVPSLILNKGKMFSFTPTRHCSVEIRTSEIQRQIPS